jgi:hypothetical protein
MKDFLHGAPSAKSSGEANSHFNAKVPGSAASTVDIRAWWFSCFRVLLQADGNLPKFFRSFFRKPVTSGDQSAASLWPMPLPYPAALKATGGISDVEQGDKAFQLAVNFAVLLLNWLHLRRPATAPAEVCLGRPLSKVQWRSVRVMEQTMEACRTASPVSAVDMGRTASKIEDFEEALNRLKAFEEVAAENLLGGYQHGRLSKHGFAPGLRKAPAGEILGALTGNAPLTAKPIVSDRLEFRGVPAFNPSPFLDSKGREVFERPIQCALRPEESVVEPPPVKIHCSLGEKMKLLRKLDDCSRLGMVPESEVLVGYQAGLFCVGKDLTHDRLIFDSRPFNTLEVPLGRWVRAMSSAMPLLDIQLEPGEQCRVSGTDLRDFYYGFLINDERLARNSLVGPVDPKQFRGFKCHRPELEDHQFCYLCLRTLAMGDAQAVELAQTAHLGLLVQAGLLDDKNLLTMDMSVPRERFLGGVVIDDLVFFEIFLADAQKRDVVSISRESLDSAIHEYQRVGLLPHPKKTFVEEPVGEFWGCQFDGVSGSVQANLKRVIPVIAVTKRVICMGVCTIGLLEILVGSWTAICLFRRRLLSIFNVVYAAADCGERQREHVLRLSPELKEELMLLAGLAPLAVTLLRVVNSDQLFCSDASDWGIGVTSAQLGTVLKKEIHRHKLKKGVWAKLLSPLRALSRIKGTLPVDDELPEGAQLASHPLWIELASALPFKEVCRQKTREGLHINILELRAMLRVEREAALSQFPLRYFSLADSQVALGVWTKGRSSSVGLNQELQQSLGVHLGCGMYGNAGFIPTEVNSADDPTRGAEVRGPQKSLHSAIAGLEDGKFAEFDKWLEKYGASPYQCSGLPDLAELSGASKAPLKRKEMKIKRHQQYRAAQKVLRRQKGPELTPTKPSSPEPLPSSSSSAQRLKSTVVLGRGSEKADLVDAVSLPRCSALSARALTLLSKVPRRQFVLPVSWKRIDAWQTTCPGFLDLYSGKKGVAKELAEKGKTWVITFELEDSADQDVLMEKNKALIRELLESGCILGLGIAIFCSSFSRAVRPPVRSSAEPYGLANLSGKMLEKVLLGNAHAIWASSLIQLCRELKIHYWVENPDGSFLWLLPEFLQLGSNQSEQLCRLDYCNFGTVWRKRTRFLTSCHLAGQVWWCSRDHRNVHLKGWNKQKHCAWTRFAQTYPRALCKILATALLIDCGLLPNRRHVLLSSVSRCQHCRIGEAKNPGLRRVLAQQRDVEQLRNFTLVNEGTASLGNQIWKSFQRWLASEFSSAAVSSLQRSGEVLGLLVVEFGRYLYASGQSIYLMRQLVTHIQRVDPPKCPHLYEAWRLISRWESLEPTVHRTPMPFVIYRAMVSSALAFGWRRVAGVIVLIFEAICRPGEVLKATRSDLLLPCDLIAEDPGRIFLRISNPKSKRRGLGTTQHAKVQNMAVANFLQEIFGHLDPQLPLYPASATTFRKRWNLLLETLHIPITVGLTPVSLRAGGAVKAYRSDDDITKLLWKMRLKNLETLQHYLQEVGAESAFLQLPNRSKSAILAASAMFEAYLQHFSSDGSRG